MSALAPGAPVEHEPSIELQLLRHPLALLESSKSSQQQRQLVARCLMVIALGGAVFGASVGWYRGGLQTLAAALKIPVVTVLSMAICGPAFVVLSTNAERRWTARDALAAMLVAGARSSMLLAAMAPLLWLGIELGLGYHAVQLSAALAYGVAGLGGLSLLRKALGTGGNTAWAALGFSVVFALVGGQSAWLLRPYIGAPGDSVVPIFVDRQEGGLSGALERSAERLLGVGERGRRL